MPIFGLSTFGSITATSEGTFGDDAGLGDLLTATGQVQLGDLLMGPGTDYVVAAPDIMSRSVRSQDFDRAHAHGAVPGSDFLSARPVGLRIAFRSTLSNFQAKVDTLSAAFQPMRDGLVTLAWQLPDGTKRCMFGRPRRFQADLSAAAKSVLAVGEFVATDPLIYKLPQIILQEGAPSFPGLVGPVVSGTLPAGTWGGTGAVVTYSVVNGGNWKAPWYALLSGPLTNPRLANVTTGDYLQINGSVESGHYLYLSSQSRSLLIDGAYGGYHMLDVSSRWWDFDPGTSQLLWLPGISDPSDNLFLTFRSTYL